jgi:hypothetical protein
MENKKSTLGNYLLILLGFSLLFILMMMFQSCTCNSNQPTTVVIGGSKPPVKVDSTLIEKKQEWGRYYRKLYIKESGMNYVIYTPTRGNDFQVINITKDSLDCVIAKQRLEIINKYR